MLFNQGENRTQAPKPFKYVEENDAVLEQEDGGLNPMSSRYLLFYDYWRSHCMHFLVSKM